ncbi:MAG: type VI secretion system baseplate subunit TssG [Paracoccaceae bacterium]
MADVAGHPRPDLSHRDTEPLTMGFFELLRRLETDALRFGRAGGPEREPARLGQRARLSFSTRDVGGFTPGAEGRPPRVEVELLGLLGPEGALPLHITRWTLNRLSDRWFATGEDHGKADTTFLDFVNMLQHRMLALYWRAWADQKGEVQAERGTGGRSRAVLGALAGTALPGIWPGSGAAERGRRLAIRHATSLASGVHGVERLTGYVGELLGAPVDLVEFVGHWMEIPAHLQTRLGRSYASLGKSAAIGARSFQRQTRAELRVGPIDLGTYRRLLADGALAAELRHAVRFACGEDIDFDLRLVLAAGAVPDPVLGKAQLGRTLWVSPARRQDADDYRIRFFTGGAAGVAA